MDHSVAEAMTSTWTRYIIPLEYTPKTPSHWLQAFWKAYFDRTRPYYLHHLSRSAGMWVGVGHDHSFGRRQVELARHTAVINAVRRDTFVEHAEETGKRGSGDQTR